MVLIILYKMKIHNLIKDSKYKIKIVQGFINQTYIKNKKIYFLKNFIYSSIEGYHLTWTGYAAKLNKLDYRLPKVSVEATSLCYIIIQKASVYARVMSIFHDSVTSSKPWSFDNLLPYTYFCYCKLLLLSSFPKKKQKKTDYFTWFS
jgi:hypothetical protein